MNADNEKKNRQRKILTKGVTKMKEKTRDATMNNAPSTCAWNFL